MMGAAEFPFGLNTTAKDPLCPETISVAKTGTSTCRTARVSA